MHCAVTVTAVTSNGVVTVVTVVQQCVPERLERDASVDHLVREAIAFVRRGPAAPRPHPTRGTTSVTTVMDHQTERANLLPSTLRP